MNNASEASIARLSSTCLSDKDGRCWEKYCCMCAPSVTTGILPTFRTGDGFGPGGEGDGDHGGGDDGGNGGGAGADALEIDRARFRSGRRRWTVEGKSSGGPNLISVHVGPTLDGPVIGVAVAEDNGDWELSVRSDFAPDATKTISIQSSAGEMLLGFPIEIK